MACIGIWALAIARPGFGVGMIVFAVGLTYTGVVRYRADHRERP